jgi:hypothetical protein
MAKPQESFDAAIEWAAPGSNEVLAVLELRIEATKTASERGFPRADDGIRTHDLLHGKQTL